MLQKTKIIFFCFLCGAFLMAAATPLWGIDGTILGKPYNVHGFFRQEAAWGWSDDESWGNMSDYMTVQFEGNYGISDKIQMYFILRGEADWVYDIRGDSFGSHKPNNSQFMPDWFDWLALKTGNSNLSYDYKDGRHKNQFNWRENDRGWEILREFYFDLNPTDKLSFRIGKQQVVWGETDGLRLMDIINPSDWSKEFILRDSDAGYEETRIPLWLIKGEYYFGHVGDRFSDVALEVIWNPGDIETTRVYLGRQKLGQNAFGFGAGEGGVWGLPYPNFPFFGKFNLRDAKHSGGIDNSEFALRFKFTIDESWMFTLNYFHGWADDFVLRVTPPNPNFPNVGFSFFDLEHFPVALEVDFDLWYPRMEVVGFTLNKDMHWLTWRASSPVLRVEALYEFDKAFNSNGNSWARDNPLNNVLIPIGFPLLLPGDWSGLPGAQSTQGVKFRDQIRYVLGFDWQLWCKPLNPEKTFFTSFQFAHYHIMNKGNLHLLNAPYFYNKSFKISPWDIPEDQFFVSFLCMTEYDHGRILPLFLFVQDINAEAWWIKAKCQFAYGDHWRPEIGFFWINGNDDTGKSFGLFDNRDQLFVKIKYQF